MQPCELTEQRMSTVRSDSEAPSRPEMRTEEEERRTPSSSSSSRDPLLDLSSLQPQKLLSYYTRNLPLCVCLVFLCWMFSLIIVYYSHMCHNHYIRCTYIYVAVSSSCFPFYLSLSSRAQKEMFMYLTYCNDTVTWASFNQTIFF